VNPSSFVIVTGLSGSGKGTFLRALEDLGYFCVDNLPVPLVSKFYDLTLKSESEGAKVALGIDVRERDGLRDLTTVLSDLRKQPGLQVKLLFLEASDPVIVRRFSETRRPHPLDPGQTVLESIAEERTLLAPVRAVADHILDTSTFTIHDLRNHAVSQFQGMDSGHLLLSLVSFGFKYGVPIDSDLVFDVRFLPNPNFVPDLKPLTGSSPQVMAYMNAQEGTGKFLEHLRGFMDYLIPQYEKEGKSYVTISIGCTGGRHRSVFITNEMARYFEASGCRIKVTHRDVEKS